MLSANEQRVESKLYEDMTPICFNASVYRMDRQPENNKAIQASREDKPESSNASFRATGMVEDFSISSTSFVHTEATKAV